MAETMLAEDHRLHEHQEICQKAQGVEHPRLGCGGKKTSDCRVRLPYCADEESLGVEAGAASVDRAP